MTTLLNFANECIGLLRAAARDWLNADAPVIGYIFKVLLACLLAMWLSLRFELDQPRTAMLTVVIVMQLRSGMVFAKSYYRLLGTIVGILASFMLVALFAQERVLFLLCMAIWIGLCTAGSMIFRNHQSYAFVLAGYTLCIVGLPATISPELTFDIGATRISEILIGLLCATLVSDLIFPQRVWDVMLETVRHRFRDFSDLLRATALNPEKSPSSQAVLLRFVSDIFTLESFRASSGLEYDASRQHRLRLSRMNNEFMEVSTSYHALEQLLRRQRNGGNPAVSSALLEIYRQLGKAIALNGRSACTEHEALTISARLAAFRNGILQQLTQVRQHLPQELSGSERLDFETGAALLQRLTDELIVYARTYASLASQHDAEYDKTLAEQPPRLERHFDPLSVTLAGVRGTLTLAVLSALWIFTDWRSGIEAITIGVIASTLFAATPSPTHTIKQFMIGAVLGTILAYFCNFHLLTQADGFVMLALAVSPAILLATWLTTRPAAAMVGVGIFIVFLMHIGFNSIYSANPIAFMNDAIADLLAVFIAGVMYELIDLSSSRWSRQRIARALRRLVVSACRESLALRRIRLETSARDLVQRSGSARRVAEEQDRIVIEWLLSVLEIGHAVIALRELLQEISSPAIVESLLSGLDAIAQLYEAPSEQRRVAAIDAIDAAMISLHKDAGRLTLAQSLLQQLRILLHFIRSALLDEESVLACSTESVRERN